MKINIDTINLNNRTATTGEDVFIYIMLLIIIILLILMIIALIIRIVEFSRELKYINAEIRRTKGAERKRWKQARRKLCVSLFLINND